MNHDLRGWQDAHLPTPTTPPATARRGRARWIAIILAIAVVAGGGWMFRDDLMRALRRAHRGAEPVGAAMALQPVNVLTPRPDRRTTDAASAEPRRADQVDAAKRGIAIADNEIAKANAIIARDGAAIRAAHVPRTGQWAQLKALYAQARTDQQRYDVSVTMHNLDAQEQNAQREIAEQQHDLANWQQRRAQLVESVNPPP